MSLMLSVLLNIQHCKRTSFMSDSHASNIILFDPPAVEGRPVPQAEQTCSSTTSRRSAYLLSFSIAGAALLAEKQN